MIEWTLFSRFLMILLISSFLSKDCQHRMNILTIKYSAVLLCQICENLVLHDDILDVWSTVLYLTVFSFLCVDLLQSLPSIYAGLNITSSVLKLLKIDSWLLHILSLKRIHSAPTHLAFYGYCHIFLIDLTLSKLLNWRNWRKDLFS